MGNSLRCCLACVLPCGAFDVVRIVHLSGQVEEHSCSISAGEILAANPGHVISKPCSSQGGGGTVRRRILIVSPEAELRRGDIYFLIPAATATLRDHKRKFHAHNDKAAKQQQQQQHELDKNRQNTKTESTTEKKLSRRHRHRRQTGWVGVWRPHLESICEGL